MNERDLEVRLGRLESRVMAIRADLGVLKANGATKFDVVELSVRMDELRADLALARAERNTAIAELRAKIVLWLGSVAIVASSLISSRFLN